jgi:hypothetical protein
MSEEPFKPTRYELALVDALTAFSDPASPHRVIVRVFCRIHGRGVARVEDVPNHGALLIADRPVRRNPRLNTLRKERPKPPPLDPAISEEGFWRTFDKKDFRAELLEHPDVLAEALTFTGWCAGGKHEVPLPTDLLEAVDSYRRGGGVVTLTI